MSRIDRATAQAFAQAINRIRPDWDVPGIRAAFERIPRNASLSEALRAATNLAENAAIKSPALLADDGPWWDTAAPGNTRPAWVANRDACLVHPGHDRTTCRPCADERGPELTPDQITERARAMKAEVAAKQREVRELSAQRRAIREGATP